MKLIALKPLNLFGSVYRKGDSLQVTEQTAERLIRAKEARPALGEVSKYLSGMRCTTPANKADGLRVIKR